MSQSTPSYDDTADSESLPSGLPDHTVFVVETNSKVAAAIKSVVEDAGFRVVPCATVTDVMRMAKETTPDVVLLDVNLPTAEMAECARSLGRCYQTSTAVVLATCRGAVDHQQLSTLIDAGVFVPIYPPLNRDNIHETVRMAVAESVRRQASLVASMGKRVSSTKRVEGNNSLLIRPVQCPFHSEPVTVNRYMLRARCVETETSYLDIAVYKAASRGADFVNFHLPAVMVCPRCLFASIDAKYFRDPEDKRAAHNHTPATRSAILDSVDRRKMIAPYLPPQFFTEERTIEQAIIAYQLAIMCSATLFECNRYSLMNELVRQGNYQLRIAHLRELQGAALDQTRPIYRAAYAALEQGFMIAEPPVLYKATYQLVAIAIAEGNDKQAFQYIARLNEMERELPEKERGPILPYLTRSQKLWEDRDMHRWPVEDKAGGQ